MATLQIFANREPFVAFVGAGVSGLAPSCLPTWYQFNDNLLQALCRRIGELSGLRQPVDEFLSTFIARRNETKYLAPDFQAQLIEEQCGGEYFRVWQSLDGAPFNRVHAALAGLAKTSRLKAIITTNFDCLLEAAPESAGVPFTVYFNAEDFARLRDRLASDELSDFPVVKIHGSLRDISSLVDTLSQRVAGRPQALIEAVRHFAEAHEWMFLGYSGADFEYDANYLGIRSCASRARGFAYLTRSEGNLIPAVRDLVAHFGAKARVVTGSLPDYLLTTFGIAESELPTPSFHAVSGHADGCREAIGLWASKLDNMTAANIVVAMLEASGQETDAFWLLRRVWKSYRAPSDLNTPSYLRYNYNYGRYLLAQASIENKVQLRPDQSNLAEWANGANENACEFLARAFRDKQRDGSREFGPTGVGLLAAGAALAEAFALRGEVGRGLQLFSALWGQVTSNSGAREADICDVAISGGVLLELVAVFGPGVELLQRGVDAAAKLGDEPRRARALALLARLHGARHDFAQAERALSESERICDRLDLQGIKLGVMAARANVRIHQNRGAEAFELLTEVSDRLEAKADSLFFQHYDVENKKLRDFSSGLGRPLLCLVWLDLMFASILVGRSDEFSRVASKAEDLIVDRLWGYHPHFVFVHVQGLLNSDAPNRQAEARGLIDKARRIGVMQGNPWVAQQAAFLEKAL